MQLQSVAKEGFRTVGVEAEDVPTPFERPFRVCFDLSVILGESFPVSLCVPRFVRLSTSLLADAHSEPDKHGKRDE